MLSFLRFVLVLLIVSVAVTLLAHLAGSTSPVPFATLFTNPDGSPCQSPCLFGIIPGQTTVKEALLLLKTHPLTQKLAFMDIDGSIENQTYYGDKANKLGHIVVTEVNNGLVDFVEIEGALRAVPTLYKESFAALGDIMTTFGSPSSLDASSLRAGLAYFSFIRDSQVLIVESRLPPVVRGAVDPHDDVTSLILIRLVTCSEYKNSTLASSLTPWLGLASVSRYRLAPIEMTISRKVHRSWLSGALCQA